MRKLIVKAINLNNNTIEDLQSEGCFILNSNETDKTRTGGKHLTQSIVVSFEQVKKDPNKVRGLRNFTMSREKLLRLENGEAVRIEEGNIMLLKTSSLNEKEKLLNKKHQ